MTTGKLSDGHVNRPHNYTTVGCVCLTYVCVCVCGKLFKFSCEWWGDGERENEAVKKEKKTSQVDLIRWSNHFWDET
jgi:hypothetical protein